MYYIGIDWGKAKCGIAIADKENLIASSYKQVSEKEVFQEVFSIFSKEDVEKLIVGFHSDLEKQPKFRDFLTKIKENGIEYELENEILSTKMAQKNMIGAKKKKISQRDDVESAKIILQGWLDRKFHQ